ncbi:hypothetical protein IRJ41_016934 [Triplophysa rosa]|uniref:Uncharacterized protein n=1 Tax=Triplophysa rosa TaxID=992332 RepID=A0A9W7WBB3_TRIRA|nr:hypothetical protein IRJ41_016934 [Triplophysa rosa]
MSGIKTSSFRTSFGWGLLIVLEKPRKALTYYRRAYSQWFKITLCQSGQGESARGEAGEVEAALRALSSATTPWKRIFGGSTFLGFSLSVNRTSCTNANLLFLTP